MKMSDVFGDNVLLAVDGAGYCINQIHYFNPSKIVIALMRYIALQSQQR